MLECWDKNKCWNAGIKILCWNAGINTILELVKGKLK